MAAGCTFIMMTMHERSVDNTARLRCFVCRFLFYLLRCMIGFQPSVMVGSSGAAEVAQAQFRALDVFIVQANTNTLLSHFCSLAASLWLLARTPKLAKLAKGVY